jgi:hypothetical protein
VNQTCPQYLRSRPWGVPIYLLCSIFYFCGQDMINLLVIFQCVFCHTYTWFLFLYILAQCVFNACLRY